MICRATDRAYCICMGQYIVHKLYTVMSSIWHSLVVYVTENDYSQTFKVHNVMEKKSSLDALRNYERPSLEVVSVVVEGGFSLSNNQEPSPWEDM